MSANAARVMGIIPPGHKTLTDVYSTPQKLFDELNSEFKFTLDACATAENTKCGRYYTPAENGLAQDWAGEVVFMNPPYSDCYAWMKKAWQSDATVVCLVPARTDTAWWHEFALKGEIRYIRGRLRFSGSKVNAPFPSAIVVFWRSADNRGER